MTYDEYDKPNRDRSEALELCVSDSELHPAIEAEYETYFNNNYTPGNLPDTFDQWLDKQSGQEIALIVSEWHFNANKRTELDRDIQTLLSHAYELSRHTNKNFAQHVARFKQNKGKT